MQSADYKVIHAENTDRSAQVIQIESSKLLPSIIMLSLISVSALVVGFAAWSDAKFARTEARLNSHYITRLDALLVEQGIRKAGDDLAKFKEENKE